MLKKDTIITCQNGHYICKVSTDVDLIDIGDDLTVLNIFYKYGEIIDMCDNGQTPDYSCPMCGGDWMAKGILGGIHLHTENGWV